MTIAPLIVMLAGVTLSWPAAKPAEAQLLPSPRVIVPVVPVAAVVIAICAEIGSSNVAPGVSP